MSVLHELRLLRLSVASLRQRGINTAMAPTWRVCTLLQCMANLWRFHRPIRSSVSGVNSLGWFLPGGLPSPLVTETRGFKTPCHFVPKHPRGRAKAGRVQLRVAFVVFFFVLVFFAVFLFICLFVFLFIWLLSKEDIGSYP